MQKPYIPALPFLRAVVSPSIRRVRAEQIKHSSTPAATYRLWIEGEHERSPRSLVVKKIEPDWPDDPGGHEREARFFAHLLPRLGIPGPRVYYAGLEPGTALHLVIMEDLAGSHRFPGPGHLWRQAEIEPILRSYARLHTSGQACLAAEIDRSWMLERHEKRLVETAANLPGMVEALVAAGIWERIPGFNRLLRRTIQEAEVYCEGPATVLHNDVTPSNCGIPFDRSGEAVLVDWEMVGWGLAEMDLAYLFLQPFGNHRMLDREAALDYYWRQREKLGLRRPPPAELKARQAYADALWALWLVPVATRMARAPYPPGSAPRTYWDSMHAALGERLGQLADAA